MKHRCPFCTLTVGNYNLPTMEPAMDYTTCTRCGASFSKDTVPLTKDLDRLLSWSWVELAVTRYVGFRDGGL